MPITGTHLFTAGDVLTAADTNQYLMRGVKVFADAATRTAAYGGAGEPTLEEGEFSYLADGNDTQYYDGAAWQDLGGYVSGELMYAQTTANVAMPANTYTLLVAGSAYTFDGSTTVVVTIGTPEQVPGGATPSYIYLYDNGVALAHWSASGGSWANWLVQLRLTPSAGAHTFSAYVFRAAAGDDWNSGTGTGGALAPSFIRVSKA